VATGKSYNLNEVVGIMNRILGKNVKTKYDPERIGDVRDSLADITKARNILRYCPKYSFEEGLKETINWYSEYFRNP
jgi:nucleoside-diphosphate-sugar epimerase